MAWVVFDRANTPLTRAPSLTIQRRGIISMNRAAWGLIGNAETVELLWDADARIVGLRPSSESANSYTIRAAANRDSGQVTLTATAFTAFFNIDTAVSRRWEPYVDDGVLCVDLKTGGTVVRGNRSSARGEEAAPE